VILPTAAGNSWATAAGVYESSTRTFTANPGVTVPEGSVKALIVFGPCRFFGLFGRGEDYYIPWECVQKFGDDIILVDKPFRRDPPPPPRRKKGWLF
jgi:hypothetical protein